MNRPARLRPLLALLLLLAAGVGLECTRQRLNVDYARCWQVLLPGPACVLAGDRILLLWAPVDVQDEVEIQTDKGRLDGAGRPVAGGRQWSLEIPEGAKSLEVRARGEKGSRSWTLAFVPKLEEPGWDLFAEATKRAEAGDDTAAVDLLQKARRIHLQSGLIRNEALDVGNLVRSLIQLRRFEEARAVLQDFQPGASAPAEASYLLHYSLGLLSENIGNARVALSELADAAQVAERMGLAQQWHAAEQVRARQLQALGRSREAASIFERLAGDPSPEVTSCDRALVRVNQGWVLFLAGEAGENVGDPVPVFEEAWRLNREGKCEPLAKKERNSLLNLAMAHLQAGRFGAARRHWQAYRSLAGQAPPLQQLWSLDLEARLAVGEQEYRRATERYAELARRAEEWSRPEMRWRAAVGTATCFEAQNRPDEALAEYERAEALLDQESLRIPIQEGRDTFAAQRRAATDGQIELLLSRRRVEGAFEVVRRDRSRVLRELARVDRQAHLPQAEQDRWRTLLLEYQAQRAAFDAGTQADLELPEDQRRQNEERRRSQLEAAKQALDEMWSRLGRAGSGLPPLRPGEVVLAYRPLAGRWVGFAAGASGVDTATFDLPPDDGTQGAAARQRLLADRLLASSRAFEARIQKAKRVRVLPVGELRSVDFHALPFGPAGQLLLDHAPVVYGLDIDLPRRLPAPPAATPPALIVGDPSGNLPGARKEAKAVYEALGDRWQARLLLRSEATWGGVQSKLDQAALFHYAGHGQVSGFGGWESELPLADRPLTLGDLLALDLERVPAWVVLSGCETGRSGADALPVEGVSLAHAFLLAGSRGVIASTRKVDDREALDLLSGLYRELPGKPDLAVLLQRAQLAARDRHVPESAWASFRAFEP